MAEVESKDYKLENLEGKIVKMDDMVYVVYEFPTDKQKIVFKVAPPEEQTLVLTSIADGKYKKMNDPIEYIELVK